MLKSIKINNLRSFKGHYDIPLKKFNLLFGNNGTGKSTIFEAIELGISAQTHRTKDKSELPSYGQSEYAVSIADKNGEIKSTFSNGYPSSTYAELLSLFYDIRGNIHPAIAQSLLNTLFSTHNILTQEKIIRLLDIESTKAFDNALKEMIAGRSLVDISDKIERLHKAVESNIGSINHNLQKYDAILRDNLKTQKELEAISIADIVNSYQTLVSVIEKKEIIIFNESGDPTYETMLRWIQNQKVILTEIVERISNISELLREEKEVTGESLRSSLIEVEKALRINSEEIESIDEALRNLGQATETAEANYYKLKERLNDHELELSRMTSNFSNVLTVENWRKELSTYYKLESLRKDWDVANEAIETLQRACDIKEQLPTYEEYSRNLARTDELNVFIKNLIEMLQKNSHKLEEIKKRYRVINDQYENWQRLVSQLVNDYESLVGSVQRIIDRENIFDCPVCGTPHKKKDNFVRAFNDTVERFRKTHNAQEPVYVKQIQDLEKELEQMNVQNGKSQRELDDLTAEQKKIKEFFSQCDENIANLRKLVLIGIQDMKLLPFSRDGEASKEQMLSADYYSYLKTLIENTRNIRSQIDDAGRRAWAGLRHAEFIRQLDDLLFNVSEVENILSIDKPFLQEQRWGEIVTEYQKKIKIAQSDKENIHKQIKDHEILLARSKGSFESNEKALRQSNDNRSRMLSKKKRFESILSEYVHIQKHFAVELNRIEISLMHDDISILLTQLASLEKSLYSFKRAKETISQQKAEFNEVSRNIYREKRKLVILKSKQSRMNSLKTLDELIKTEYTKYLNSISNLFLKLHQPPDYAGIKLSDEGFGLKVISRYDSAEYPATVLSSGQRAALAISIFLTLNLHGRHVPPIMLMDEPIQQVDDLNSLNFLDVLRWIVEKGDRQVLISTANSKVAGLIRKKFSYLKEDYSELNISRNVYQSSTIQYINHMGDIVRLDDPQIRSA